MSKDLENLIFTHQGKIVTFVAEDKSVVLSTHTITHETMMSVLNTRETDAIGYWSNPKWFFYETYRDWLDGKLVS
jgi:hypothetical protein